jgi:hypothetical protein
MKFINIVSPDIRDQLKGYGPLYDGDNDFDDDQTGGVLPVFAEYNVDQQGNGWLGSLARGAWRLLKPLFVSGAKTAAQTAVGSAGGFLGDVISGANVKESAKARLNEAGEDLRTKFENKVKRMSGAGMKRQRLSQAELGSYSEDDPAAKVRKIIDEMNRHKHKNSGPGRKVFSLLPPPERIGRDLSVKKRLVKSKFSNSGVQRASARIAQKRQQSGSGRRKIKKKKKKPKKKKQQRRSSSKKGQKGRGFEYWLD